MSYIYHIITPLRRYENLEKLFMMLMGQRASDGVQIRWHILMDDTAPFHLLFQRDWIHVYRQETLEVEFYRRCNGHINRWLDTHQLWPTDRYCILNDDDAYEPEFFHKLNQQHGPLVIASMMRGHHTPPGVTAERAHSTNTLVAAPENMKVGHVGVEQFFAYGSLLSRARLPMHIAGDGEMVQWLVGNSDTTYAPDANVWFNYFEPGRWDK